MASISHHFELATVDQDSLSIVGEPAETFCDGFDALNPAVESSRDLVGDSKAEVTL